MNIRVFKVKLNNYINFAINNLNSLKYKNIKIFYKILDFEYFYVNFILYFVFIYILFAFLSF